MQKNEKPLDIAEVLARRKPQLIAKRAMDILLSACALAVLWPLLLLIALAVVIDDPGPVFYRQVRIGRDGRGQQGGYFVLPGVQGQGRQARKCAAGL